MIKRFLSLIPFILITGCASIKTEDYVKLDPTTGAQIEKGTRETKMSFSEMLFDEMKVKDIAWWKNGWFFRITVQLTGSDNYLPNFTVEGGKVNAGHISLTEDSKQDMANCIHAMTPPLTVDTSGTGIHIEETTSK